MKERLSYNAEAWRILSMSALPVHLSSLCAKWKGLLHGRLSKAGGSGEGGEPGLGFIDLFQSRRRQYGVRGVILSDRTATSPKSPKQECHYLFLLERIIPDAINLCMLSRLWNLSRREQEIVRLLLADKSNKEMAHTLRLSPNTVKGYLKLLMRRLGVSSRTGVISRLLTGRNPSSPPPQ